MNGVFRKPAAFVAGLLLILAAQSKVQAQELRYAVSGAQPDYAQGQTYSPNQQAYRPVQPLNTGQLEQLVAPIALYPDALIAQILAASTYPQQVTDADGWRHGMANAPAEQVAAEADAQAWDPSVKALTAFPQVLAQMDRNLQWTTDLGNAYYNQPEDVLEAVQVMRGRARDAGNLQSTPQETVSYNQGYIELAPANPQVVYVPAYNPWTAYGEPVTPYPGFNLLGVLGDIFGGTPLRYGLGIAMSAFTSTPWGWLAWGLDWLTHALLFDHSDYYSHSNTVADWVSGAQDFTLTADTEALDDPALDDLALDDLALRAPECAARVGVTMETRGTRGILLRVATHSREAEVATGDLLPTATRIGKAGEPLLPVFRVSVAAATPPAPMAGASRALALSMRPTSTALRLARCAKPTLEAGPPADLPDLTLLRPMAPLAGRQPTRDIPADCTCLAAGTRKRISAEEARVDSIPAAGTRRRVSAAAARASAPAIQAEVILGVVIPAVVIPAATAVLDITGSAERTDPAHKHA